MGTHPFANSDVAVVFDSFPADVRGELLGIRKLILEMGTRIDPIGGVEESLKWGEPSYATICGSAVRLGWKRDDPSRFRVLFHCQTKLIGTFRELYADTFEFEGNRALVFQVGGSLPLPELGKCLELALSYHKRKDQPRLGADFG